MKTQLAILSLGILFTSCAATVLNTGADKVRFVQQEPKDCKYLGEATGNQGNFLTGGWTSNENLETGARNELKNKVFEMGGNTVMVLTNRAGATGSYGMYGGSSQQTNVTLTGTVYSCPLI